MITNFDNETAPLNELEVKAANVIKSCLKHAHIGEDTAVTGDAIIKGLSSMDVFRKQNGKSALSPSRIRKIINYLRTEEGLMIVSCNKGYYIADNPTQVRDCIRSLQERADAILHVAESMKRSLRESFYNDPKAMMAI